MAGATKSDKIFLSVHLEIDSKEGMDIQDGGWNIR